MVDIILGVALGVLCGLGLRKYLTHLNKLQIRRGVTSSTYLVIKRGGFMNDTIAIYIVNIILAIVIVLNLDK